MPEQRSIPAAFSLDIPPTTAPMRALDELTRGELVSGVVYGAVGDQHDRYDDAPTASPAHADAPGWQPRDGNGLERSLVRLAERHVRGAPVDWNSVFAGSGARRVELPTYASNAAGIGSEVPLPPSST
jgi:acyl transferase domain-containing protein